MTLNMPAYRDTSTLRIALPSGHLEKATLRLFSDAGLGLHRKSDRDYKLRLDEKGIEVTLFRSMEVPPAVASGSFDIGITGFDRVEDWVLESYFKDRETYGLYDANGRDLLMQSYLDLDKVGIAELRNLGYGKVRMVLAVPREFDDVDSLGKLMRRFPKNLRMATEFPFIGRRYVKEKTNVTPNMILPYNKINYNSTISIIYSWGATEGKPPVNAEAVIENMETCQTLDDNNLKEIETVGYSTARLIANKRSLENPAVLDRIGYIEKALMSAVDAGDGLSSHYHLFSIQNPSNARICKRS